MRIAIVDDDEMDCAHLRDVIETYIETRNADTQIDAFSSGEDFMQVFEPGTYDLIFFDNYLGNGLGIDIARKARALDKEAEFVFVSMSPEFAISSFEVRALHYLLKPATLEAVAQVFERLLRHAPKLDESMIEVICDYRPVMIPVRSIRYIETVGRMSCIHGENEYQTLTPLKKLLEDLPPATFVRTHSSYAVRLSCIRTMGKAGFVLDDGKTIPIGRAFNSCKSAYIEYRANQGKE